MAQCSVGQVQARLDPGEHAVPGELTAAASSCVGLIPRQAPAAQPSPQGRTGTPFSGAEGGLRHSRQVAQGRVRVGGWGCSPTALHHVLRKTRDQSFANKALIKKKQNRTKPWRGTELLRRRVIVARLLRTATLISEVCRPL